MITCCHLSSAPYSEIKIPHILISGPSPLHFSKIPSHKLTTEGPAVQGSASRVLGGRDEIRSQSNVIERWIPPSAIRRDALPEASEDVKFRKVRGILNKLTPQTFDKLSDELINIGLDSQVLLKGVILLIFDKALQEPKYASMYAQLCKKLSNRVPNFDEPNPDSTTTFRRLLLNKCQDEYSNRARASALFEKHAGRLTPDEEEQMHLAKRKMLGNIKFICELGRLEMLTHSILHKCCEELVKKTTPEDLECLCQIMSTCGPILDNNKGKFLMNQYFSRMKELSNNEKFPPRIRFMLQDVLDLRENNWMPRQVSAKENPKPIHEIRREVNEELGISDGLRMTHDFSQSLEHKKNLRAMGLARKKGGMGDLFSPPVFPASTLGTGPGVITAGDNMQGRTESNGYNHHSQNYRPSGGMRMHMHNNYSNVNPPSAYYQQQRNNRSNHYPQQEQQYNNVRNNQNNMTNGHEKPAVAPRFMQKGQMSKPSGMNSMGMAQMPLSSEELSFRPPKSIMVHMPPPSLRPNTNSMKETKNLGPSPINPPINILSLKEPPPASISANKSSAEKPKKKDKGPTKEDMLKKLEEIVEEYVVNKNLDTSAESLKNLQIPERFICHILTSVLNKAMDRNETDRELAYQIVIHMVQVDFVSSSQFLEAFRNVLEMMSDLEADIPRIKTYVAAFAARAISQDVMTLANVAEATENGNYYPFLLLVLQQLGKCMDKTDICKMFEDNKINLLSTLPKSDRTKDRMAEILEERELSFLFPLMKIQAEMTKQIATNPEPAAFLDWINENVKPAYHTSSGFVSALMTVLFKHIISSVPSNDTSNEKVVKGLEAELLNKYRPITSKFLSGRTDLQLIAIYAVQAAWFALGSPKVMLLRWFMNLYELDIIEDEAFFNWKEDIRDEYPGKGNALFQVNQWIQRLEQEEEEEEDEDEVEK